MFKQRKWKFLHPFFRIIERNNLIHILPRDRILSATSRDGYRFDVDAGIRVNVFDAFGSDMVYGNAFAKEESRQFMFYNGGFYQKGGWKSQVIRVESIDGLKWENAERLIFFDAKTSKPTADISIGAVDLIVGGKSFFYGILSGKAPEVSSIVRYESEDGLRWVKGEPYIVVARGIDPFILKDGNKYLMYYSTLEQLWEVESDDGICWGSLKSLSVPAMNQWRCGIGGPSVVYFNGCWHLYFYANKKHSIMGRSICHAISKDREKWDFPDFPVLVPECSPWAGDGLTWPCAVVMPDGTLRLYFTAFWGKGCLAFKTRKSWEKIIFNHAV